MPFINGIGPGEIIIILIIALIVVGPGKLPDVGSALGKSIREFRKAATDVKESTSLEPAPAAPAAPAPVPAAQAAPAAPVTSAEPAAGMPPAPVAAVAAATPIVADASAAPEAVTAQAAEPATPAGGADAGDWPAELAPADEQQPTPSA